MQTLSRTVGRLCLMLVSAVSTATIAGPAFAGGPGGLTSPFFSRWTVSEDRPVFTIRGRSYRTIDVAPCGADFCGVSVSDGGACGPVLFRFLARHASGDDMLQGHGRWGDEVKNIQIFWSENNPVDDHSMLEIYLGDGHDFGGRSNSMPTFHANYRRLGGARCRAS